ncbi:MAG: PilZ domain-containing protein [Candidatus Omnitrophota bacterium]
MFAGESTWDRRQYVRVNSDFPVQINQIPRNNPVQLQNSISIDMSEGGLQLSSFYFYPVNSRIMVEIFHSQNKEPMKSMARIVWMRQLPYQDRYKVGIEFTDLSQDNRYRIKELIQNSLNA